MINKAIKRLSVYAVLILALFMMFPGTTNAQDDILVYEAEIIFPSQNEVSIISFEYAEQNDASSSIGRGISKAQMADILVTKYVDDYSPELFINCADGSIFYEVTITLTDPEYSDSDLEHPTGNYLEIKLEDVTVTSYMFIGETGAEPPKESFTLGYSTIKYTVQLVDRTWDLEKNREL